MGIFRSIKLLLEVRKAMKNSVQEFMQQQSESLELTTEALAALDDESLFFSAVNRAENIIDDHEEMENGFAALNDHQKVLFAVNLLESEVNNGGLCQFFVNSSRAVAPYISGYLALIGAEEHKALFDGFITRYQIDLNELSSFVIHRARDFEKMTMRYPFDEYDDAFYELPSLEEPLTRYIRANIDAF